MLPDNDGDGRAKTVERAFEILEYLKRKDGSTLDELAEQFGKSKSTVHRYVTTLAYLGYVVKENNSYYPSVRFLGIAEYARNRIPGYPLIEKKVDDLAEETGERVEFFVEEQGKAIYVYRSTGETAVKSETAIGDEVYLHSAAGGKAILTHFSQERINRIIEYHGLPALTDATIIDKEKLLEELQIIQENGYSVNNEETTEGLRAVAVPILGQHNRVIGALSISGPSHRMKGEWFEAELPNLLLGISNELELNISRL